MHDHKYNIIQFIGTRSLVKKYSTEDFVKLINNSYAGMIYIKGAIWQSYALDHCELILTKSDNDLPYSHIPNLRDLPYGDKFTGYIYFNRDNVNLELQVPIYQWINGNCKIYYCNYIYRVNSITGPLVNIIERIMQRNSFDKSTE